MKLIFGLGNPGIEYEQTRHNIGKLVVLSMAKRLNLNFDKKKTVYQNEASYQENPFLLAYSRKAYMNESGPVIRKLLETKASNEPSDLLVVVDDIYLPFGKMRFRSSGSSGGHNGLESIIDCLGSSNFARLRVGVGVPDTDIELKDHVLDKFSPNEEKELEPILGKSTECALSWLVDSPQDIMQKFN